MFVKLHFLALIFLMNQVIGADKSSSSLDIIETHLNGRANYPIQKTDTLDQTEAKINLKSEIVQSDKKYLERMLNFHSVVSTFWRHTNNIAQISNYVALAGGALGVSLDFYYRYHDQEQSSGNSLYNNMSFSFALAAFGTNLLQMIAYRMHNKSEAIKRHLHKSLIADNPLESFVKLERSDSELSENRAQRTKKKKKAPKCSAVAPSDQVTEPEKTCISREDYAYIHNVIQKNARFANIWRAVNGIAEFINVFTTIGTSVATGIDFFYRRNDLAGTSANSDYNKTSIALTILSILTKIAQTTSYKQLQKSERRHIHMLTALNSPNVIEVFKKLEKGIYPDDSAQQQKTAQESQEQTKENAQQPKAMIIHCPFTIIEESLQKQSIYKTSEVELSEIAISPSSQMKGIVLATPSISISASKSVVSISEFPAVDY